MKKRIFNNSFPMAQRNLLQKFLLFFFDQLYHQLACCYDFIAFLVSAGQWKFWVLSVEEHLIGPNILELGHGPGHLQTHLKKSFPLSVGLDESRQMGRIALYNIYKAYPGAPNRLIRARAQSIPFVSEQFNTVVATFPSEYIFEESGLQEIHRVLRFDGKLVILLAVEIIETNFISRLLKLLYSFTGETPTAQIQNQILTRLERQGFFATINRINQKYAQLFLITAQKS